MKTLIHILCFSLSLLASAITYAESIKLRPGQTNTVQIKTLGAWTASDAAMYVADSNTLAQDIDANVLFTIVDSAWVFIEPSLQARGGRYELGLDLLFGVHRTDFYISYVEQAEIIAPELMSQDNPYEITLQGVPDNGVVSVFQVDGSACDISLNGYSGWDNATQSPLLLRDINFLEEDAKFWVRYNSDKSDFTTTQGECRFALIEATGDVVHWSANFQGSFMPLFQGIIQPTPLPPRKTLQ